MYNGIRLSKMLELLVHMSPVVGRQFRQIGRRCFVLFSGLVTTTVVRTYNNKKYVPTTVPQYATYDIVDDLHDAKNDDRSSDFEKKGIHTMLTLSLSSSLTPVSHANKK